TYTRDAAAAILASIEKKAPFGTYHVTNSGECSWFEFAAAIFEILGLKVHLDAVSSSTYPTKAKRPAYSVLSSDKLARCGIAHRDASLEGRPPSLLGRERALAPSFRCMTPSNPRAPLVF
ncbi:MAG: sugar nucleotide-binding protein, partial [Candidatus Methanosuratincola petrocarbonis]